jgi:hypothetical protein
MYIGISTLRSLNQGSSFSPASLFASGEKGAWYDPSDITTLFQDAAGTIPVTASGQPVGRILDKSGNGAHATQSTDSARPTYTVSGGLSYLLFDGSDDWLTASSVNLSATNKVTFWAGVRKLTDSFQIICETSTNTNEQAGSFAFWVHPSFAYYYTMRGSETVALILSTFTAPITNVHSCSLDLSQSTTITEIVPRVNAATPTLATVGGTQAGGGNFENHALYIGRRAGNQISFNGQLHQLIIRGAASSAGTISLGEKFVGGKCGIAL